MYTIIIVFIAIACVLLVLSILIQNPKGGGLSQTFGGFSNQILGVKQTTDLLEKITWILVGSMAGLCMITLFFLGQPASTPAGPKSELENINLNNTPTNLPSTNPSQNAAPTSTSPQGVNPLDSTK